MQQKIVPFLWCNGNAEEAANFYVAVFSGRGGEARGETRVVRVMPGVDGVASGVTFRLEGQEFYVLNGGPQFPFTEAVSFFINCDTQEEVDYFWEKLSEGGAPQQCGWLKDKFGLSWQVVPTVLGKLLHDKDPERATRVMGAMLRMTKIDIAALEHAYDSVY